MIVTVLITFSWGDDRDMTTDEEFSKWLARVDVLREIYSSLTL